MLLFEYAKVFVVDLGILGAITDLCTKYNYYLNNCSCSLVSLYWILKSKSAIWQLCKSHTPPVTERWILSRYTTKAPAVLHFCSWCQVTNVIMKGSNTSALKVPQSHSRCWCQNLSYQSDNCETVGAVFQVRYLVGWVFCNQSSHILRSWHTLYMYMGFILETASSAFNLH